MAEVAAASVVPSVAPAPKIIGRQRQKSAGEPEDVVCAMAAKKRMVAAVVLDDENPDQETGGR
jgi:hypothetical protein